MATPPYSTGEDPADPLTIELLTWIREHTASYAELMEVWRTNCPRHSVWEDAVVAGMVEINGEIVQLTPLGLRLLDRVARGGH